MNGNKFLALCLKTQWENGDTCKGCVLAEKGVCERMTPDQIAKTHYAVMLKRSVAKREKEKTENVNLLSFSTMEIFLFFFLNQVSVLQGTGL